MSINSEQRKHWRALFERHGDDPRSLGHRDRQTQQERFYRIARLFDRESEGFSVHEVGFGLGHFGQYLREHFPMAVYSGSEIDQTFVDECQKRFPKGEFHYRDVTDRPPDDRYDFVTNCGTLLTRLSTPTQQWQQFIFAMLDAMYQMARIGIAANFLTARCDSMDDDLHYQEEGPIVDFIVNRLSRHFQIDAAGPMYEYTVRVYRPEYVRALYPDEPFARYFKRGSGGRPIVAEKK